MIIIKILPIDWKYLRPQSSLASQSTKLFDSPNNFKRLLLAQNFLLFWCHWLMKSTKQSWPNFWPVKGSVKSIIGRGPSAGRIGQTVELSIAFFGPGKQLATAIRKLSKATVSVGVIWSYLVSINKILIWNINFAWLNGLSA